MTITRTEVNEERIKELDRIRKIISEEENTEREDNEENREPLSVDLKKEIKILLSWGGPEDGFKLKFDNENNLLSGVYYMAHWGEYEESELTEEEADEIFNFYLYGDISNIV